MGERLVSRAALLLLFLGASPPSRTPFAVPLALEDYLHEVSRSNPAYRGLRADSAGHLATAETADLIFAPQAFANITYINDTRDTQVPAIQGDHNIKRNLSLGLRKQMDFGLQMQFSFELNQSSLLDVNGQLVAQPDFLLTYVSPQFNLSLWQNFLGRSDRANARLIEAQARSEAFGKDFEARLLLVDAEERYWKLAIDREVVRLEQESLERASALLELDQRKQSRHLADRADLLLAQSAVKGKELELAQDQAEARDSARTFNAARGSDSENVPEDLVLPSPELLPQLPAPPRGARRGDVVAAEQGALAAAAGGELARDKLLPSLNLYGSVYAIGLNLTVPLNLPLTSRIRSGYAEEMAAADLLYEKKARDQESEWQGLAQKFQDAAYRFKLATELERIQHEKYENAKMRKEHGLTVSDQVFQYELDFLTAALNRVQLEGLLLGLRAQMKTFGGDS